MTVRTLLLAITVALAACATEPMPPPKAKGDDVDRIVAAVGVDAMHSVDEEARMQELASQALNSSPNLTSLRASPDFERVVRHLMQDNQRMRRDPSVFQAYRTTLERMLTPAQRAVGAGFYGSPEGQKAHAAVLEGERAAAAAMDDVATRMGKEPPPNFSHYFHYGIDVFFARDSAEVDPLQRERIVSILKKPRDAEPGTQWCALLVGFTGTGERASTLAERRREAVKRVVIEFGIPEGSVGTYMEDAKGANLKPGDPSASIAEIEQFPCDRRAATSARP